MSKQETLLKVQQDIAEGDLGIARDRLLGLFSQYPADLEIRAQLGRIFADLRYPEQAGRFWYLEEHKTDEMKRACEIFERRCGHVPAQILARLGNKVVLDGLADEFSKKTIQELKQNILQSGAPAKAPRPPRPGPKVHNWGMACLIVAIAAIVVFIMGLIHIFEFWIMPIVREFFGG